MEKEIKVRKRRFAAFWAVMLLICGLVIPAAADEAGSTDATDTTQVTQATESAAETTTETIMEVTNETTDGQLLYSSQMPLADATEIGSLGSTAYAGTTVTCYEAFEVRYFDYDDSSLNGGGAFAAAASHTIIEYSGKAPAGCTFEGWSVSRVYESGKVPVLNLIAQVSPLPIDAGKTYSLTAGEPYILNSARKVNEDPSVYGSGWTFYVSASGTYTFH